MATGRAVKLTFDEYYKTDDDTSFGGDAYYRHAWNNAGHFQLSVSLRERPTPPVVAGAMKAYFSHLEFELFDVRALEAVDSRFDVLRALTELEREVIADAKSGWNEPLADPLRAEIGELAAG